MMALALVFDLIAFVCGIIILIHAFSKGGALQGILCLCVPFYILYYAFARFEHEKKNLILAVWLGSAAAAIVIVMVSGGTMMPRP